LGASKMEVAEKAYSDALDLEPENAVGKTGYELAKAARVKALSAAVADAKKGGGVDAAREALRRSLEMNPDGPEARKAFAELLDEAKAQGAAGNDRQAAALLDAANVVSKPETVRNAITAANKQLADGGHADAEKAYDEILSRNESKVASTGKEIARMRRVAVLREGALELKKGGDVDRGAKATAELLELDATDADAKAAIDGAMKEAERLAATGDDKGAARILRAAAKAAKESRDVEGGIIRFESGKYDDAAKELEKSSTELARRIAQLVRARKLGTLKAGLSGDDRAAAEAIKALLSADPNNKEAQAAFEKLLAKARDAAAKGDYKASADALQSATIASSAPEKLAAALDAASTKLGEKLFAAAEKGFVEALDILKDSKVAKAGQEISKKARLAAEKDAVASIARPGDPGPAAKILAGSLAVEPSSKIVTDALKNLLARAKKAGAKPDDADAAQSLDAAAALENGSEEWTAAIGKANAELAKGNFVEAEQLFTKAASPELTGAKEDPETGAKSNAKTCQVCAAGVELARARRVMVLKGELEGAKKDNDVLRQSTAVVKILELDPKDKTAVDLSKRLKVQVVDSRLAAAKREREFGKLGVAWVYAKRALVVDESSVKAKEEVAALEDLLKKQLDLVVLVDKVARATSLPGTTCAAIEDGIRDAIMEDASKRTDLGAFFLNKDWSALVEKGDKQAPAVGGKLELVLAKCQHGASVGKATIEWKLVVPGSDGGVVAKGTLDADLPTGLIPRDEQDGEGKNAKRLLAKRTGKALVERLEKERDAIDLWLLALAEHGVAKKDTTIVADAWARMTLKKTNGAEPARLDVIQKFLDAELK
ncbi:hypothetical protein L6R52_40900, partial [Myxococcota bacterium]|nr:hypothetical protein [Myxococcota bacterium]